MCRPYVACARILGRVTLNVPSCPKCCCARAQATYEVGYGTVLDSGTTFTYLPSEAFLRFREAVTRYALAHGLHVTKGPDPKARARRRLRGACFYLRVCVSDGGCQMVQAQLFGESLGERHCLSARACWGRTKPLVVVAQERLWVASTAASVAKQHLGAAPSLTAQAVGRPAAPRAQFPDVCFGGGPNVDRGNSLALDMEHVFPVLELQFAQVRAACA